METIRMVDLKLQYDRLKTEMDEAIRRTVESTAFINGPEVHKFAGELADFLNVEHVIPCGNGTDALQVALMALNLEPGDEVITTPFSFIASIEVIRLLRLVPVLVDVEVLDPELASQGPLAEVYRTVAVLRSRSSAPAVDHLEKVLAAAAPPEIESYLDLAKGQLGLHRFADAERTLLGVLERSPGHPLAREWLALARFRLGRTDEAVAGLRQVVSEHPERAESWFNLGLFLIQAGDFAEALGCLRRAVDARPNMASAWYYLGVASERLGRAGEAAAAYRRALEVDPAYDRARLALGEETP